MSHLPFEEARLFVHRLGLKKQKEWREYCKSKRKNSDIPTHPERAYKDQWISWGDWFGTGTIATFNRKYLDFETARAQVQALKLSGKDQWGKYSKSGNKPPEIPNRPDKVYKQQWKGFGDWLGTGVIATFNRKYLDFETARAQVQALNLNGKEQWAKYCKSGRKHPEIPYRPDKVYKKEWKDWADWFGYDDPTWSLRRVKELLTDLIRSRVIYEWDEAVLYSLLLRKGLLNLHENNRHRQFFKNLLGAVRTNEGRQLVENYVKSDSDIPPNLAISKSNQFENLEEIQPASLEELSQIVENVDPLEYGRFKNVEHILKQTDVLESINVDEEAMQFYLNYSIDELWKLAFKNEQDTIQRIRFKKKGNKYHDTVVEKFLTDYDGSRKLEIPRGYSFSTPTLMQLYVAYKVSTTLFW